MPVGWKEAARGLPVLFGLIAAVMLLSVLIVACSAALRAEELPPPAPPALPGGKSTQFFAVGTWADLGATKGEMRVRRGAPGTLSLTPDGIGSPCPGTMEDAGNNGGPWSVLCPGGLRAAGTWTVDTSIPGVVATGRDDAGRTVEFRFRTW